MLTLLLLIGIAVPVFVACDGTENPADTTGGSESGDPDSTVTTGDSGLLPPVVTDKVLNDKTDFELKSGDSLIRFSIQNGKPYLTAAQTLEKGQNRIQTPTSIGLPSTYQKGSSFLALDWKYEGYLNYRPEGENNNQYGYILRFRSESPALQYDLYITARYTFDGPFEFTGYITNGGKASVEVIPGVYFNVNMQGASVLTVWTFDKESGSAEGWTLYDGTHVAGTGIYKTLMTKSASVRAATITNQNWNAGGDIPMIYVDYNSNFGLYYGVEWSNCHIKAESSNGNGDVQVSAGLGERNFITTIPTDSSLYLPTVYMGVYEGDVDDGSNIFKRWFLYNKSPSLILKDENEPLTQEDLQHDINTIANYGIQSVKWDYGWWSGVVADGQTRWQTKEGLLELEWSTGYAAQLKNRGCNSMKEYADLLKSKNLTWAVYVLLKDCKQDREGVPTSVGKYGQPEWFSNRVVTVGASVDLGNVDCVAFYQKYLLNFFKETGVTTWRSDFEPICFYSDKANRHDANGGDVQYWCTVGFLELVDYLYDNLDYFRYESCSSGGSMKDLLTATRAVVINCDDSADFQSLKMSFYDSSYCFHPTQLQLPVNTRTYIKNSKYYTGIGDYVYGLRSQLIGAVMLASWDGATGTEQLYWQKYLTVYNARIKPLIRNGDLYHILPRPDGVHWDGFAYIDADAESSTKGLVMLWKPTNEEGDTKVIKLRGLNAETTYRVNFDDRTEQSCTMTGAQLMNEGLSVTMTGESGSEWIWIVEQKS